jgi:hypothetical protein
MPSKLPTIKAAAVALVAVLSIGGVAAATGLLPGQAEQAAEQAASITGAGSAAHGLGKAAAGDLDKGGCPEFRGTSVAAPDDRQAASTSS